MWFQKKAGFDQARSLILSQTNDQTSDDRLV